MVYSTSIIVDSYVVEHYIPKYYTWKDRILLYNEGVLIAKLEFYENDILIKAKSAKYPTHCTLCFEMSRFEAIVNTLRYEKPVFIAYEYNEADNIIEWGRIGTDINRPESIGEQEGA